MNNFSSSPVPAGKAIGSAAIASATHLFGTLTCMTCWTIFGPSLALLFGSSGTAFLATLRPYAPIALVVSAIGLGYSFYQLTTTRGRSAKLPFQLAAAFTTLSAIGWTGSAVYTIITLLRG